MAIWYSEQSSVYWVPFTSGKETLKNHQQQHIDYKPSWCNLMLIFKHSTWNPFPIELAGTPWGSLVLSLILSTASIGPDDRRKMKRIFSSRYYFKSILVRASCRSSIHGRRLMCVHALLCIYPTSEITLLWIHFRLRTRTLKHVNYRFSPVVSPQSSKLPLQSNFFSVDSIFHRLNKWFSAETLIGPRHERVNPFKHSSHPSYRPSACSAIEVGGSRPTKMKTLSINIKLWVTFSW